MRIVALLVISALAVTSLGAVVLVGGPLPVGVLFIVLSVFALLQLNRPRPLASMATLLSRYAVPWGVAWGTTLQKYVIESNTIGHGTGVIYVLYGAVSGIVTGAAFGYLFQQWVLPQGPLVALRGLSCGVGASLYTLVVMAAGSLLPSLHRLADQGDMLAYSQWVLLGGGASGVLTGIVHVLLNRSTPGEVKG